MQTNHALILHAGGIRSLVATALTLDNDPQTRLSLLFINDGRDNAHQRLEHVHRQAEFFQLKKVHQLDLLHLYGHGQGKAPDGTPMGPLVAPQMLLAALAWSRHIQAGRVIWPASFNGDHKAAARATEQALLADQSGDCDMGETPRIDTPLLELTDRQVIELGQELHVPWERAWSCVGYSDTPCRVCPGCRRRKTAFHEAGVVDPLDHPARVVA